MQQESLSQSNQSITPSLEKIRAPVLSDLVQVNKLIIKQLHSDIPLIQTVAGHILDSGGKRLRPLLVLLSSHALNYQGTEHHELAVIVEFVHTATLLHDDVVDQSKRRRGQKSANELWGNQASILVGDFLYSRAFQLLAQRSHTSVIQLLSNTTNEIAEGEISQLASSFDPDVSEADYRTIIYRKTASLFAAASEMGAVLSNSDNQQRQAMRAYGLHLGMAFQIIDDLLDYLADAKVMGKNAGDDLAEGKMTLPLIHALAHCQPQQKELIKKAVREGDITQFKSLLAILSSTKTKEYVLQQAQQEIDKAEQALATLPASPAKESLTLLGQFILSRSF